MRSFVLGRWEEDCTVWDHVALDWWAEPGAYGDGVDDAHDASEEIPERRAWTRS